MSVMYCIKNCINIYTDIPHIKTINRKIYKDYKDVQGIGTKRIKMIKTAWDEQKDIREVMIFLQGYAYYL